MNISSNITQYAVYKCKISKWLNTEIEPVYPEAKVWIGSNDLNEISGPKNVFMTYIKKIVRHPQTFNANTGGYDISLVQFKSSIPLKYGSAACLPTPSFEDEGVKVNIAGYGRYFRRNEYGQEICQTDNYGRKKYHMCVETGKGSDVCQTGPAPRSSICKHFFNSVNKTYPKEYEEIQIVKDTGMRLGIFNKKIITWKTEQIKQMVCSKGIPHSRNSALNHSAEE
jgi:hypothetical protein